MAYKNKHLIEVVCGFQFNQGSVQWDSTYFGQYYEKIKELGFNEKEERKGFQIEITQGPNISNPSISAGGGSDDVVIFKNLSKGWGIMMGKNKISFHVIKDYSRWEDFRDYLVKPFYEIYLNLGLGRGPRQCSVIYLNQIARPANEQLSEYFTVISPLQGIFGVETSSFVQRIFHKEPNSLITRLVSQPIPQSNQININLECAANCIDNQLINGNDWLKQAEETHAPILAFFEAIITEKLRKDL